MRQACPRDLLRKADRRAIDRHALPPQCAAVWAVIDAAGGVGRESWSPEQWSQVEALLQRTRIEQYFRPSPQPGVEGGGIGTSEQQLQIADGFWGGRHRAIYASGANRSGKTVTLWGMCFCRHIRDRARDGEVYWCIAPDFTKMRLGPHKWLWEYLPRPMFGNRGYTESLGLGTNPVLALKLPDDRGTVTIVFKTEDQELTSFESDIVTGIAWTEAEREAVFDSIWARLIDMRGWMLIDYVPTMAWHKFRLRLHQMGDRWRHERFAMASNAHNLPVGAIAEARKMWSDRVAAIRIDGEEGAGFGVVIPQFSPARHVCDRDFAIPPDWPRWRAMDYGFANPTACLWVAAAPDETLYVYREHYAREQTVSDNASSIQQLSGDEEFQGAVLVDPSAYNRNQANGESIALEFKRAGLECRPAVRTNKMGMHASVEQVRQAFASDRIKILPRCQNLIRELQSWRCREGKDGEPMEVYEDKDDHSVDALRYCIMDNPCYSRPQVRVETASPAHRLGRSSRSVR
ncbi:MAG: hypothetical protein WD294_07345 [Phycisphaeraceae bacterium]